MPGEIGTNLPEAALVGGAADFAEGVSRAVQSPATKVLKGAGPLGAALDTGKTFCEAADLAQKGEAWEAKAATGGLKAVGTGLICSGNVVAGTSIMVGAGIGEEIAKTNAGKAWAEMLAEGFGRVFQGPLEAQVTPEEVEKLRLERDANRGC